MLPDGVHSFSITSASRSSIFLKPDSIASADDRLSLLLFLLLSSCFVAQRDAAEGQSKNESQAKQRVAENESAAASAEAACRAEAHVQASGILVCMSFGASCTEG